MPRRHLTGLATTATLILTILITALSGVFSSASAAKQPVVHPVVHAAAAKPISVALTADKLTGPTPAESAAMDQQLKLVLEENDASTAVQNSMFSCIRTAESGDRYAITSGAYGILVSTWWAFSSVWSPFGHWNTPGEAPAAIQDLVAYHLYLVGGGYGGWHDRCTGV